jgi:hypothetical protein
MTGTIVIGTGGKLLEGVKRLIGNLRGIRSLALNQLLLDVNDVPGLLDPLIDNCLTTVNDIEVSHVTCHPLFLKILCASQLCRSLQAFFINNLNKI